MKETAKDKQIEKLKKQVKKRKNGKEKGKGGNRTIKGKRKTAQARGDDYHEKKKKKETPKDGLDRETFELMMSLLDDISTQR